MYYDTLFSSDTLVVLVIPCRFQGCFQADDFAICVSGPSVTDLAAGVKCILNLVQLIA